MSEAFPEYHKINSIQKRHADGPNKGRFTGELVDPLYDYLGDLLWTVREKVDGTNIRVNFFRDPETDEVIRTIGGRTDNAQIPVPLVQRVLSLTDGIASDLDFLFPGQSMILYGEGYGGGIQKGARYGPINLILFDIKWGKYWQSEDFITEFAHEHEINRVPYAVDTLNNAIQAVSTHTVHSQLKVGEPEGLVCVPLVPLVNQYGERVIVKIKGVDY